MSRIGRDGFPNRRDSTPINWASWKRRGSWRF